MILKGERHILDLLFCFWCSRHLLFWLTLLCDAAIFLRAHPCWNILFLRLPHCLLQSSLFHLRLALQFCRPDCILTDVGSVKTPICRLIESLGIQDRFIGGHPMAGSERIGFANAKASLLENAYYIIAPAAAVPAGKVEIFRRLVSATGAIPLLVDPQKHDYITAAVSHLPHIIAASLVNLVKDHDGRDGLMKSIAAGGFKDITRIASSSAVMWEIVSRLTLFNLTKSIKAPLMPIFLREKGKSLYEWEV